MEKSRKKVELIPFYTACPSKTVLDIELMFMSRVRFCEEIVKIDHPEVDESAVFALLGDVNNRLQNPS